MALLKTLLTIALAIPAHADNPGMGVAMKEAFKLMKKAERKLREPVRSCSRTDPKEHAKQVRLDRMIRDICEFPAETICNTPRQSRYLTGIERLALIQPERVTSELAEEIRAEAYKNVAKETISADGELASLKHIAEDNPRMYVAFQKELLKLTQERLPYDLFVEQVKDALKKRIRANPRITDSGRDSVAGRVDGTMLQFFPEYLEKALLSDDWERASQRVLRRCHIDGLGLNGWKSDDTVVLCPGVILAALGESRDESGFEIWKHEIVTIAHEIGHQIDFEETPGLYTKLKPCLTDNLKAQRDRTEDPMREITADFWASEAMAWVLENDFDLNDPDDKFKMVRFLTMNLHQYCGWMIESERHPTGDIRIRLMFLNEGLRKALGCPAPRKPLKACGL